MPRKKKNYGKTTNIPKNNSNISFLPNQANLWNSLFETNSKIPQKELNQYQSQLMQAIIKYKIPSYQEQINDFKKKLTKFDHWWITK